MAEQNKRTHKPFEGKISEETRQHFRNAREEFHKSMEGIVPLSSWNTTGKPAGKCSSPGAA